MGRHDEVVSHLQYVDENLVMQTRLVPIQDSWKWYYSDAGDFTVNLCYSIVVSKVLLYPTLEE